MNSKDVGDVTELKIAADLANKGYNILFPYGENQSYDLVAERDGKFIRIQCKSPAVDSDEDKVKIHCRVVNHTKSHKYKKEDFDYLATCYKGICYYVPSIIIENKASIILRLVESKTSNQYKSRLAKEFLAP